MTMKRVVESLILLIYLYTTSFFLLWSPPLAVLTACGRTLPAVSPNYVTLIELTFPSENTTFTVREIGDADQQRLRVDYLSQDGIEVYDYEIIDYYWGIKNRITKNGTACESENLTRDNIIHSPTNLRAYDLLFRFADAYNATYQGVYNSRGGIACDVWTISFTALLPRDDDDDDEFSASNSNDNNDSLVVQYSFDIDYYFSVENWDMFGTGTETETDHQSYRIPIRATVGYKSAAKAESDFYYVSFINFSPIPAAVSAVSKYFELPSVNNSNINNNGKKEPLCKPIAPLVAPVLPNDFASLVVMRDFTSTTNTTTTTSSTSSITRRYYYDHAGNRIRTEEYEGNDLVVRIKDYKSRTFIEVINNGSACYTQSIPVAADDQQELQQLPTLAELLRLDTSHNYYTYRGVSTSRGGIPCDVFRANLTNNNELRASSSLFLRLMPVTSSLLATLTTTTTTTRDELITATGGVVEIEVYLQQFVWNTYQPNPLPYGTQIPISVLLIVNGSTVVAEYDFIDFVPDSDDSLLDSRLFMENPAPFCLKLQTEQPLQTPAPAPSLPKLPDALVATIDIAMDDQDYMIRLEAQIDYVQNKMRMEYNWKQSSKVEIYDIGLRQRYDVWNEKQSTCQVTNLYYNSSYPSLFVALGYGSPAPEMKRWFYSTEYLLHFFGHDDDANAADDDDASPPVAKYLGVSTTRARAHRPCHVFRYNFSSKPIYSMMPQQNATTTTINYYNNIVPKVQQNATKINYELEWCLPLVGEWPVHTDTLSYLQAQYPLSARLTGRFIDESNQGTSDVEVVLGTFVHHYEIMLMTNGTSFEEENFAIPAGCIPGAPANRALETGFAIALLTVSTFIGIIIGSIIGGCIVYWRFVRRLGRRPTTSTSTRRRGVWPSSRQRRPLLEDDDI